MNDIALHNVHFLVLGNYGRGYGWYTPRELPSGFGATGASLAIPVTSKGAPYPAYCASVVTLDEGVPILLPDPFELQAQGDSLRMDTPPAFIHFRANKATLARYRGELYHPDFVDSFVAIYPVEDIAYNLLFAERKAIIIGTDPAEYNKVT